MLDGVCWRASSLARPLHLGAWWLLGLMLRRVSCVCARVCSRRWIASLADCMLVRFICLFYKSSQYTFRSIPYTAQFERYIHRLYMSWNGDNTIRAYSLSHTNTREPFFETAPLSPATRLLKTQYIIEYITAHGRTTTHENREDTADIRESTSNTTKTE